MIFLPNILYLADSVREKKGSKYDQQSHLITPIILSLGKLKTCSRPFFYNDDDRIGFPLAFLKIRSAPCLNAIIKQVLNRLLTSVVPRNIHLISLFLYRLPEFYSGFSVFFLIFFRLYHYCPLGA